MPMSRVKGSGPLDAQICVVGESPGEQEVELGQPFVGRSGLLLKERLLPGAGLAPELIRFENICELRPKKAKSESGVLVSVDEFEEILDTSGNKVSFQAALNSWVPDLYLRLENLPKLEVIVAAGRWPARVLLNNPSISLNHRGSIYDVKLANGRPVTLVCTVHPAFILRDKFPYIYLSTNDLVSARRVLYKEDWHQDDPILHTFKSYVDIKRVLEAAITCYKEKPDVPIALDLEWLGGSIDIFSFGHKMKEDDKAYGYSICLFDENGHTLTFKEELDIWRLFQELLLLPNHKVGQNFQSDLRILSDSGFSVRNFWWDTRYAQHILNPHLPASLDVLCSLYTYRVPYYKDERTGWGAIPVERRALYGARDAAITALVQTRQEEILFQSPNQKSAFFNVSMPQLLTYHRMEVNGIPINKGPLHDRASELETELTRLNSKLSELRYGNTARGNWLSVLKAGESFADVARHKLETGCVGKTCEKCGGTGESVSKQRKSPDTGVVRVCKSCKGVGRKPYKRWKSLAQLFDRAVKSWRLREPIYNPQSRTQTREWLFTKTDAGGVGIVPDKRRRTATGQLSVDSEALNLYLIKAKDKGTQAQTEILEALLNHSALATEQSNFAQGLLDCLSSDGRLRTTIQPLAETGRCISKSDQYGEGRCIHNLPREGAAKRAIEAPEGFKIEKFDLTQGESLFVFWDANWKEKVQAILRGEDLHTEAAEIAFNKLKKDFDPIIWKETWRQAGKRVRHAGNYGMGPQRMREQLLTDIPGFEISEHECAEALFRIAAGQPLVENRKLQIIEEARLHNRLTTPYGRLCKYFHPPSKNRDHESLSYRPQSSISDYTNFGLALFERYWLAQDERVHIFMQKHDEVAWFRPDDLGSQVILSALNIWSFHPMIPLDLNERFKKGPLVIPMEFSRGSNFNEMEELKEFNKKIDWVFIQKEAADGVARIT